MLWKDGVGYRGTQQYVYRGRRYYILRGVVADMVVQVVVAKNLVMTLDLCQPTVVLDEGLIDIHGQLYQDDL